MNFNEYPYSSRRKTVMARNGMVATSQPLAAQAGLNILQKGGNAVDAAIATAAALTVVEPTSNGIGGDTFALIWTDNKLKGLNSSGPAPQNISVKTIKKRGYKKIPEHGFIPITVPGAPAAWAELSDKYGSLSFEKILKPAIRYADKGYPVSPVTAKLWKKAYKKYKNKLKEKQFKNWFKTFAPNNKAPEPGEIWKSKDHATTLKEIADTRARSFYKGKLARKMVQFSNKYDGFLSLKDLAHYSPEWGQPVNIDYRGYQIWEIPPNTQGIIALMALNIIKGFDLKVKDTARTYHRQIEALKLAFADGKKYITDKNNMQVKVENLLNSAYIEKRRKLIKEKALTPEPGKPDKHNTVYLATADGKGNMVSLIQSNYMGFGSGLVVPGTGIALQNRGNNFNLDPEHSNCIKPGKKTYHTIIPGFLTKDNIPIGPFGVMGGFMQPQGHLQIISNLIDFNLNPQAALDAPRWQWVGNKKIKLEPDFPHDLAQKLSNRGHDIEIALNSLTFGRGQIIWKNPENNVLIGGTEPRTDGNIAVY